MSGGVYLIGTPNGPKKIGYTKNFRIRLAHIQHYQAHQVFLLETWDIEDLSAAFAVEQASHAMLWHNLMRGEWFAVSHAEGGSTIDAAVCLVNGRSWRDVVNDLGMTGCEHVMRTACCLAGMAYARSQGRVGGRAPKFSLEQLEAAFAATGSMRAAAVRIGMTTSGFTKAIERERARVMEDKDG